MAAKLILECEPDLNWDKCPFMSDSRKCIKTDCECLCVGGYYDSLSFDFGRCPYCTTLEKALEKTKQPVIL